MPSHNALNAKYKTHQVLGPGRHNDTLANSQNPVQLRYRDAEKLPKPQDNVANGGAAAREAEGISAPLVPTRSAKNELFIDVDVQQICLRFPATKKLNIGVKNTN